MRIMFIIIAFFLGLLLGKIIFESNNIQNSDKVQLLNKIREPIQKFKNENKQKLKDIKVVKLLPSFIKQDLKSFGLNIDSLSKEEWGKFLQLLNQKSIREFPSYDNKNLLDIALEASNIPMVKYLLNIGYDINQINSEGESLLVGATKKTDLRMIKFLLNNGLLITEGMDNKVDLLNYAFRADTTTVDKEFTIQFLLENGYDFRMQPQKYYVDILRTKNPKYLNAIINEINPNKKINKSYNNLEYAIATNSDEEALKILLSNYNFADNADGFNILHVSASSKSLSNTLFREFINKSKDVLNSPDIAMLTPLMYAVQKGNYEKAEILLENSAEINYINLNGKTAYDYITRKWNKRSKSEEEKMRLLLNKYNFVK